jgi:hypothetical protein
VVEHHRPVIPELHADVAALRAARRSVETLRAALRPAELDPVDLAVLVAEPGAAMLVAEHDRLVAVVVRAARELAELDLALETAVVGLEAAESYALRSLTGADW